MIRPYEVVVLLHPDLEMDLDKPMNKIQSIIKSVEGKITKTDVWGKRRLSYEISGKEFACYVYYEVEMPTDSVQKLENALNITDEVLRYLITNPVPEVEQKLKSEEKPDDSLTEKDEEATKKDDN